MNVLFIDFDGVLATSHFDRYVDIENKVKILAYLCHKYDCKVVIESAHKDLIDEKTLKVYKIESEYVYNLLKLFKKYNIEVMGRTPVLTSKYSYNHFNGEYINKLKDKYNIYKKYGGDKSLSDFLNKFLYSKVNIWKEDEIRIYLMRHPEIEHYAIIDDDDLGPRKSDLNKVRDHLVTTIYCDYDNPLNEGLLMSYEEEIASILKKDNKIRNYVLKRKK